MAQTRYENVSNIITNVLEVIITSQSSFTTFFFLHCFVGIRRDLVSEPRKPDVYLAVNPVAFGSQLDDEIDENERCVFLFIVHFKRSHIIEPVLTGSCDIIYFHLFQS